MFSNHFFDHYLDHLFKKYRYKSMSTSDDGKEGLYLYPDALILEVSLYMGQRFGKFGNEEALKFRKFLLVSGIEEIVNKGLLNLGDLVTCCHLDVTEANKLVEIYKENPNKWSIASPKLIDVIYQSEDGYKVATKEEARKILGHPDNAVEFALSHDIRFRRRKGV